MTEQSNTEGKGSFLDQVRLHNEARAEQDVNEEPPKLEDPPQDEGNAPVDTPDVEDVPAIKVQSDEAPPSDGIEIEPVKKKKSKEENLKGLRNALSAERDRSKSLETELEETKRKLESVDDVDQLKAELAASKERIGELEKYEKLVGVKQSKEYREKYVDGIQSLLDEVSEIAKDYEVPNSVLKQAVAQSSRRQLNELLGEHFDAVAVGDVRPIILKIQKLLQEKKSIDDGPIEAEEQLLKAGEEKEKIAQEKARKSIQNTVQDEWANSLVLYTGEDSGVDILKEVPGDNEHNKTRAELINKAATEYGGALSKLVTRGLRELPADVAQEFASRFQLAEVAKHLLAERAALQERLDDLEDKFKKQKAYNRPMSAGSAAGSNRQAPPKEVTGTANIAAAVFQSAKEKAAQQ